MLILGIGTEISDEGLRPGRVMFYGSGPNELGIKLASALSIGAVFIFQKNAAMVYFIRYLLCSVCQLFFMQFFKQALEQQFLSHFLLY